MSDLCGVQTRAARMYEDPEPAEYCENEVEYEGDLCAEHDGDDEPDWDNVREKQEERDRERLTNGYWDED